MKKYLFLIVLLCGQGNLFAIPFGLKYPEIFNRSLKDADRIKICREMTAVNSILTESTQTFRTSLIIPGINKFSMNLILDQNGERIRGFHFEMAAPADRKLIDQSKRFLELMSKNVTLILNEWAANARFTEAPVIVENVKIDGKVRLRILILRENDRLKESEEQNLKIVLSVVELLENISKNSTYLENVETLLKLQSEIENRLR